MTRRERVWLSPVPGVGFRGVATRRVGPFVRVLYRDGLGRCHVEWLLGHGGDLIYPREPDLVTNDRIQGVP